MKNQYFCVVVLEKTLESPLGSKEIKSVNLKWNQHWIVIGKPDAESPILTLATWCEKPTHWRRLWCWERLKSREEVGNRGWDVWRASMTQWTWIWASFGRWWRTGNPGMLQFMGSQRVGPNSDWTITTAIIEFVKAYDCQRKDYRKR